MRCRLVNRDRHYISSIRFSPIAEQVRLHRNYEMMKKSGTAAPLYKEVLLSGAFYPII